MDRKEYKRNWYLKNKERLLKKFKQYQIDNRGVRTVYRKTYRNTSEGKQATNRAIVKYELNNPQRRFAWNKAQKLLNKPCIICGEKAHKHHPNPLKSLEVIYLCPLHHKEEHGKTPLTVI